MARRRVSEHGSALVGRAAEMSILRAALDAASAGQGGLVMIGGAPGVGKTRLAEEIGHEAMARGAQVVWVRRPGETRHPFEAWQQLVDLCRPAGAELAVRTPTETVDASPNRLEAGLGILRRACQAAPLVAILDDAEIADSVSLTLLDRASAQLRALPILVVVLYRDTLLATDHPLAALARDAVVARIALGGLGETEVSALLAANLGAAPPADVGATLHRLAGGAPVLVGEFARAVLGQRRPSAGAAIAWEAAVPRALRAVVRCRVSALSRRCQALLATAAVAGHEFDRAALQPAARSAAAIDATLREAIAAGILARSGGGTRVGFVHAVARDTLYDDLPPPRRARLHRDVAAGLRRCATGGEVLAELAHHHFAAALLDGNPDDAERAADCAEQAARHAIARHAYADAAHFYRLALNALSGRAERRRAGVWLELGGVLRQAGDEPAARAAFREAIAPARRLGEAEILARAALGMTDRYMEVGAADEGLCALLAEALVRLPPADSGLRTRVVARLAVELAYTQQPERAVQLSVEAAAMAGRCGDPAALTYAFGAAYLTSQALENPRQRLAMADQVLLHVEAAGDLASTAELCGWRVDSLVEIGDRQALDAAVARHAAVAAQLRTPIHNWLTVLFRATCAQLDGDLAAAELLAADAVTLGQQAGDANAGHAFAAQLFYVRSEQDRLEELRDAFATSVEEYPAMPGWASALSVLHSRAGRLAEIGAILDRLAAGRFAALPRDRLWLMTVALLGEGCAALPRSPHAATLYELLLPFADRHVMITGGALSWGAAARYLGMLATAQGRWLDAERHQEQAMAMNTRLRAPLLMAHTQCDRADMLLRRDRGGDHDRAQALVGEARQIAAGCESPFLRRRLQELSSRWAPARTATDAARTARAPAS